MGYNMSETEWKEIPTDLFRVTNKRLGSDSKTAVVRWGSLYRIIRVNDELPPKHLLWIFGCASPVILMSRIGSDVTVNYRGLTLVVKSWVLRSDKTIPPVGRRAKVIKVCNPQRANHWSFVKPTGCIVLRRRQCHRMVYRGVFCRSPCVKKDDLVFIQGIDVEWRVSSIDENEMCVVCYKNIEMLVQRSCIIVI